MTIAIPDDDRGDHSASRLMGIYAYCIPYGTGLP